MAAKTRVLLCFVLIILSLSLFQVCLGFFQIEKILSNLQTGQIKTSTGCYLDPDICRNVSELVRSKGYPCEDHRVQTEDGFLLSVQHIPHGRAGPRWPRTARPVVFLQHGLLTSSADWVINLANQSLGLMLADAGFDVWMGNVRGNTYSSHHIHLDPSSKEFWAWSWDEMAQFDVTAMLEYVLMQVKQPQLYYVGHSQGTLVAFAQFGSNHTLAKKVKKFFALGPVSTVGHLKGPLRYISYFTKDIEDLFALFGVNQFLPSNTLMKFLAATFCNAPSRILCEDIIFLIAGADTSQFNQTRLPVYISHAPAGSSVRNLVHFAQMVRSGLFQKYNYGSSKGNQKHYGQATPPLYNASLVRVPVELFSGGQDALADTWDVASLASQLPNLVRHHKYPTWNHLDFVWGLNANTVIYDKIIDSIRKDMASANL